MVLAVRMLIPSFAAITLFKCPSINSARTSASRVVSVDRRASISVATALRSPLAAARFDASRHAVQQHARIERLFDEVHDTVLQRSHRHGNISVAGDHHDRWLSP